MTIPFLRNLALGPSLAAEQSASDHGRNAATVSARLLRHSGFRTGVASLGILGVLVLIGQLVLGDPNATDYQNQLAPPSGKHWLGTDAMGRDMLARTVHGAQVSFRAATIIFVVTTIVGLLVGVLAGLLGSWFDQLASRICDVMLGLPSLILAMAIVGALGPGFGNLVLAMSLTGWAGSAKLARSIALEARMRPDVIAARMAGVPGIRIAIGHVLPGVSLQVLIAATLGLGEIILGLAGLSFLGLGVQPPTAEWGSMLNESRVDLMVAPWLLMGPGAGLVITVTSVTLISDALRDSADIREVR